jgi:hypothetical protein
MNPGGSNEVMLKEGEWVSGAGRTGDDKQVVPSGTPLCSRRS